MTLALRNQQWASRAIYGAVFVFPSLCLQQRCSVTTVLDCNRVGATVKKLLERLVYTLALLADLLAVTQVECDRLQPLLKILVQALHVPERDLQTLQKQIIGEV
jgi:hypothetical protein